MADKQRNHPTSKIRGIKATDITYNEQSGTQKVLGPIVGVLKHLSVLSTTNYNLSVPNGSLIALFNNSTSPAFIVTDKNPVTVLPDASNGIALKPNDYTIIALPDLEFNIAASSSNVIAYLVVDDSVLG